MSNQQEFDFSQVPQYNKKSAGERFPWKNLPPRSARKLTKSGLLGKDDVYRSFQQFWLDPSTGSLVKQYIFFQFVREMFEIKRSLPGEFPRLNTFALRGDEEVGIPMAQIFRVYGKRPDREGGVCNSVPPRPFEDWTFPHIRLTEVGVQHLIREWPSWILEYNRKQQI